MDVLLVPGFGGTAQQPLLLRLIKALAEQGLVAQAITLTKHRPTPALAPETAELTHHWQTLAGGQAALIGRSFGGRVAARLALQHTVPALVLLGFPVRPPGKRRLEDEQALQALTCPTLILQGENDELGAPAVLQSLIAGHKHIELQVIAGAKHAYGRSEASVVAAAAAWLAKTLARFDPTT